MHENHAVDPYESAGQDVRSSSNPAQNLSDHIPDTATDRLQSHILGPAGGRSLHEVAADLERMRPVSTGSLMRSVAERGACMDPPVDEDPPGWLFDAATDRELAARLCAGCPVQAQCLELELRLYGADTVGVWGALGEDDRRALYPMWKRAREHGSDR